MLVISKMRGFLIFAAFGCVWFGIFMGVSRSFSPPPPPKESNETQKVRQSFSKLAAAERARLALDQYYNGQHTAGMVDAVVEFTRKQPLPLRMIELDGFLTQHVDIAQGEDGIFSVVAVFTRRAPYTWPRSLEIKLGPQYFERVDLDERNASGEFATYRVSTGLRLDMKSPHGQFAWTVTKDKVLVASPECLYRQDLYKDGEWIKTLAAISTAKSYLGSEKP